VRHLEEKEVDGDSCEGRPEAMCGESRDDGGDCEGGEKNGSRRMVSELGRIRREEGPRRMSRRKTWRWVSKWG
jgi:hypothetical protein